MAPNTLDLVVQNEVLKSLKVLEEKAQKEWQSKWGFYLEFNSICKDEAKKRGIEEIDYKRMTVLVKSKDNIEPDIWEIKPSNFMPRTTAGKRYKQNSSLLNCGLQTLPPPISNNFLKEASKEGYTFLEEIVKGNVGWRGNKEFSLEKFGPLYISPKLTLPYEPPHSCIILG